MPAISCVDAAAAALLEIAAEELAVVFVEQQAFETLEPARQHQESFGFKPRVMLVHEA